MAINMLNENSIIKCKNCGSNLLFLNQMYILESVQTKEGVKYKKTPYKAKWICSKCNMDIPIEEKDILNN